MDGNIDIRVEFETIVMLQKRYIVFLKKYDTPASCREHADVLSDIAGQLNDLVHYTARLKTELCGGGGMVWIEKAIIKTLAGLINCLRDQDGQGILAGVEDLLFYLRKSNDRLDEMLLHGLYDINLGQVRYRNGTDVFGLAKREDAIAALDPDSMNPLEDFFYRKPHHKMTKWSHYFEIYHRYLRDYRNSPLTMLEIGVWGGGSLQMWKDYFGPECYIIGIDIMEECRKYEEDQIKIYIGSQEDQEFLRQIKQENDEIDIVIDDGGHSMNQQIVSFQELFPHLAENGIYICEDIHTSYWPDFGGGYGKEDTFVDYSKQFIDRLHARYSLSPDLEPDDLTRFIGAVHYHDSVVVIEKKMHRPSMPFWSAGQDI